MPIVFPASLSPEAGLMLHSLIRNLRPRVIVEVGTFCSVSTHWMAAALHEMGGNGVIHAFDDFGPIYKGPWRDAEMRDIFPDREPGYYGSVLPMCWSGRLEQLTRERTKQLQVWLDGVPKAKCVEDRFPMQSVSVATWSPVRVNGSVSSKPESRAPGARTVAVAAARAPATRAFCDGPARARDAAEPEQGRALDVAAQADAVDQARVDARRGDAGHRGEEDVIDLLGLKLRLRQHVTARALAQRLRALDPLVVAARERIEFEVGIGRQRQVAAVDLDGLQQLLETLDVVVLGRPQPLERSGELDLRGVVGGQGGRDRADGRGGGRGHGVTSLGVTSPGADLPLCLACQPLRRQQPGLPRTGWVVAFPTHG